jgi:hypothetical protein
MHRDKTGNGHVDQERVASSALGPMSRRPQVRQPRGLQERATQSIESYRTFGILIHQHATTTTVASPPPSRAIEINLPQTLATLPKSAWLTHHTYRFSTPISTASSTACTPTPHPSNPVPPTQSPPPLLSREASKASRTRLETQHTMPAKRPSSRWQSI